ncbi:hypothetical protein [Acidithrix ferrooxidans]|uniref:hypothetical protein n=1 Tax=Acidithrix ferrooxidans TaxID=1280514 RepID=UPI001269F1A2|nr:hypothetical protein [Acidithrix ferrooxidans]
MIQKRNDYRIVPHLAVALAVICDLGRLLHGTCPVSVALRVVQAPKATPNKATKTTGASKGS